MAVLNCVCFIAPVGGLFTCLSQNTSADGGITRSSGAAFSLLHRDADVHRQVEGHVVREDVMFADAVARLAVCERAEGRHGHRRRERQVAVSRAAVDAAGPCALICRSLVSCGSFFYFSVLGPVAYGPRSAA